VPTTSIDTFFACSLLVILVVSTMAGLPKMLYPFLDGLAHKNDGERLQQLAQYILLSTGAPSDWGSNSAVSPTSFGLASDSVSSPYALDIDKVTRLNSRNSYAINYAQLLDALKVSKVALKIHVRTLFNTSIRLVSSSDNGNETNYSFEIVTENSGLAVVSDLSCYFVVKDYVDNLVSSTNSNGKANATFVVPNNVSGSALLAVFSRAQVDSSVVSLGVYAFGHNTSSPVADGTFARLSPLDYVLNASFLFPDEQVLGAYAFSFGYWANLTMLSNATQSAEYVVPRFLDKSATVLVFTGLNNTQTFAEWVAYPQVPLEIGVNFDSSTFGASVVSFTYVVAINAALYELQIKCREVG